MNKKENGLTRKMFQYKEDYFFAMFCIFFMLAFFATIYSATVSTIFFIFSIGWMCLTADCYLTKLYPDNDNGETSQQRVADLIPNKGRRFLVPSKRYIGTRSLANYRRFSRMVTRGR